MKLEYGDTYTYGDSERLVFVGTKRYPGDLRGWHQFEKVDARGVVWCEILDSDLPRVAPASAERETPCVYCGHPFDQGKLGVLGCPNCHGEGLPGLKVQPVDIETSGSVTVDALRPGMATLAAGAKDTARLDWYQDNPERITLLGSRWYWRDRNRSHRKAADLRDAIDQARREPK